MAASFNTLLFIDVYDVFYGCQSDSSYWMWKLTKVHDWKMFDRSESELYLKIGFLCIRSVFLTNFNIRENSKFWVIVHLEHY